MFENIFSVGSILSFVLTVSVGAIVSIRALKINTTINNKSPSVVGDGNSFINNEYNFVMKEAQDEFKHLSVFIGVVIFLLLPLFSSAINGLLSAFSVVAPFFSLIGICWVMVTRGFFQRYYDVFYFMATIFNAYLAYYASLNVYYFMLSFDGYYDRLVNAITSMPSALKDLRNISWYLDYLNVQLSGLMVVIGFIMVFVSLLYATFAYVKQRGFSGALTSSSVYCAIGLVGYLLCSGILWYLHTGNSQHLTYILKPINLILVNLFQISSVVP